MEIFTIGFTQSSAERFFGRLKQAGVQRLLDIRLNNRSQLAGFAKQEDLAYFLRELCGIEYQHAPLLAPTQDILDAYKKNGGRWDDYEVQFMKLLRERHIETQLSRDQFSVPTAMLCSEATAEHCHRRLVIEYLQEHWEDIQAVDL